MSTTTEGAETQREWEERTDDVPDFALFATIVGDPSPLHLSIENSSWIPSNEEMRAKRRVVWAVLEAVKRLDGENQQLDFLVSSPEFDSVQGAHYRVKGRVTSRRAHVLGRGGEIFLTVEEEYGTVVFPAHKVENVEPVR